MGIAGMCGTGVYLYAKCRKYPTGPVRRRRGLGVRAAADSILTPTIRPENQA